MFYLLLYPTIFYFSPILIPLLIVIFILGYGVKHGDPIKMFRVFDFTQKKEIKNYTEWIGQKVYKHGFSKFKSGLSVNTIKNVIVHPVTGQAAFTFYEDDSYVQCKKCFLKEIKKPSVKKG